MSSMPSNLLESNLKYLDVFTLEMQQACSEGNPEWTPGRNPNILNELNAGYCGEAGGRQRRRAGGVASEPAGGRAGRHGLRRARHQAGRRCALPPQPGTPGALYPLLTPQRSGLHPQEFGLGLRLGFLV